MITLTSLLAAVTAPVPDSSVGTAALLAVALIGLGAIRRLVLREKK